MSPEQLSHQGRVLLSCMEFDSDEKLLYEIRKHPVGLALIYILGLGISTLMLLVMVGGGVLLNGDPLGLGIDIGTIRPIMVLIGFLLTIFSLVGTFIAAYLYTHNIVLVTDDKIAQLLYISLFNRKVSQLSLGDVQDVTVNKVGILAHIFNYGTLVIETAGEQNNYMFTYTPKPYEASQAIINAHENNLHRYGN